MCLRWRAVTPRYLIESQGDVRNAHTHARAPPTSSYRSRKIQATRRSGPASESCFSALKSLALRLPTRGRETLAFDAICALENARRFAMRSTLDCDKGAVLNRATVHYTRGCLFRNVNIYRQARRSSQFRRCKHERRDWIV